MQFQDLKAGDKFRFLSSWRTARTAMAVSYSSHFLVVNKTAGGDFMWIALEDAYGTLGEIFIADPYEAVELVEDEEEAPEMIRGGNIEFEFVWWYDLDKTDKILARAAVADYYPATRSRPAQRGEIENLRAHYIGGNQRRLTERELRSFHWTNTATELHTALCRHIENNMDDLLAR